MFRRRLLPVLLALGALAALCSGAPSASAQDVGARKDELDQKKSRLDNEISGFDQTIAAAETQVAQSQLDLNRAAVRLELVADDYAKAVDDRREPARTRVEIAIDAYMRGDPRITTLIEDLINLDTRSDQLLQRELYRAVVEDADHRLSAIDERLRQLASQAQTMQDETQSLRDRLSAAQQRQRSAVESRDKLAAERAAVVRELDDIISRANRAPLTGQSGFNDPNRPALVVKIDNHSRARPQMGLNSADVVFEELVEGGMTRFAAVFHSRDVDQVGPIRSMRSTDIGLLPMLNRPLFASSGGNAGVRAELRDSPLIDVGHDRLGSSIYARVAGRPTPHNLAASTSALRAAANGQGGAPPSLFSYRSAGSALPASAVASGGVTVRYPDLEASYEWTGSSWARSQAGRPHVDAGGARVSPTNVVVQFVNYVPSRADGNSPEAVTNGSGDVWVFTDGSLIRGRWSRPNASSPTVFSDDRGNPIQLLPGTTWVELARPGAASPR